ncbi:MAG: transposase [Desulfuromonadales bacterium]|nr:transposase [Desulfuromonadales bacterium]
MARQLRIEYPGAVYHVTSRGNGRCSIFSDDNDRHTFLKILHLVNQRYGWLCHAYCLMGNHYHLMIETPEANLSKGMRHLNGVYTQQYNRRHDLVGHLFQGRFKAILIEKDSYLLQLCRYIVQNPVAAHLTSTAEEWPWSSYQATAGINCVPQVLTVDWILQQFADQKEEAQLRYRRFVNKGLADVSPWSSLAGRIFLGREDFVEQMQSRLGDVKAVMEIPKVERFAGRPSLNLLLLEPQLLSSQEKGNKIYAAYKDHGYTQKEIADFLGVHYATISRVIKGLESNLLDCKT